MRINFLLVMLALLSISLLMWVNNHEQALLEQHDTAVRNPEEYMKQAKVTLFSDSGTIKDKLSTNYWAYLPEKETSILTLPHLTLYRPNETRWEINAHTGQVKQPTIGAIENIILKKQVIVERPKTHTLPPLKLETEYLDYYPENQYAQSDQFVSITKPGLNVTGIGLKAYLDQGTIELLNQVKTYYTPILKP